MLNTEKGTLNIGALFFRASVLFVFITVFLFPDKSNAQLKEIVDISGYVKELGQVSASNDFSELRYDNILHNRFETEWTFTENLEFNADLRTRLLNGYTVQNAVGLASFLEKDPNLIDMSWVWVDTDQALIHSQIDRFHISYYNGDFELYAGRQRINWGKTLAWNPNDLFNNYAFLDFDYEERPGVDAISAIYNLDFASSIEAGVKLADSFDEMVIAGMYRVNYKTYDLQLIAGHYQDKAALGIGWAGYIKDAGFKGEASYFHPEDEFFNNTGSFSATLGFDYMFETSIYAQAEVLYNGGYQNRNASLSTLTQPPSADNLFISRTGYLINGSYPASPLLNINLGIMGSFTQKLFILFPQVSYSLDENLDLLLVSQLLKGEAFSNSVETPNVFFIRLKWSY
ncbi:hypothetical protein [Gracilimonas sediminicola]|uniref:Uncharacterized protein n=1 Tax=Gracilimonas sediminicola TaxID=2952158 RepID=A0A9X2L1T7_9BACT|nr:hypothetical protein [Gracilimonas sediminicola]MCP9290730.1 hypothetical protein [Gracilimonas sediminicola]